MIFYIDSVAMKDETIGTQRTQIETLRQAVETRDSQIVTLQQRIEALEKKVFACATEKGSVDKVLIEKKERRLKLISKGEVLKTYRIALGGDPNGPKERQGDNKTPEGTYVIDSRNKKAGITCLSIFPIRTRETESGQGNWVFLRAETS